MFTAERNRFLLPLKATKIILEIPTSTYKYSPIPWTTWYTLIRHPYTCWRSASPPGWRAPATCANPMSVAWSAFFTDYYSETDRRFTRIIWRKKRHLVFKLTIAVIGSWDGHGQLNWRSAEDLCLLLDTNLAFPQQKPFTVTNISAFDFTYLVYIFNWTDPNDCIWLQKPAPVVAAFNQ